MWIVHSSGSHAVAAPGAEIRVRELVRCHLRWIWTNWNALSSGFSLLLSWFKESTRPITQKHRVRTFALSMFQLGARQDLWNHVAQNLLDRVSGEPPRCHPFPAFPSYSSGMGFVLTAAIFRSLSITLLSQRNFNQGTFANLCRITLD